MHATPPSTEFGRRFGVRRSVQGVQRRRETLSVAGQADGLRSRRVACDQRDRRFRNADRLGQELEKRGIGLAVLGHGPHPRLQEGPSRRIRRAALDPVGGGFRRQADVDEDGILAVRPPEARVRQRTGRSDRSDAGAVDRRIDVDRDQILQEHDGEQDDQRRQVDAAEIRQDSADAAKGLPGLTMLKA